MDLSLSDEQQEIAGLAARILGDHCPPERLRELERRGGGPAEPAADAWAALAGADLLGLALPVADGGSGLGVTEAALVAQQVGRYVAPVPYWTSTSGALAVARWGTGPQRTRHLSGAISGDAPLAVALWQPAELGSARAPAVTAADDGDGYRLDGVVTPVPWAPQARTLLVPARRPGGGRVVLLVPADAPGLELTGERAVDQLPTSTVTLDGVRLPGDALLGGNGGAGGEEVADWLARHTAALLLATAVGVCEEALALTARHVSERQQFGTPIGTFQAVAHRCADAYIDTEAIRLTTLQVLWRLDVAEGRAEWAARDPDDEGPEEDEDAGLDPGEALEVATLWACEGGQRVVHAAQHLHGGIGVDVDHPVHRYFRWAKVLELLLGGPHAALLGLGGRLAGDSAEPGTGAAAHGGAGHEVAEIGGS